MRVQAALPLCGGGCRGLIPAICCVLRFLLLHGPGFQLCHGVALRTRTVIASTEGSLAVWSGVGLPCWC